jgi:hypothetical protein
VPEHLEDGISREFGFSLLIDFSEDVTCDFFVDFKEPWKLTCIFSFYQIVNGALLELGYAA